MGSPPSKKDSGRNRKPYLFTLAKEAKEELERRSKATSIPKSRLLDRLILSDPLSDEAEGILSDYCARAGVSREAALSEAVLRF
tara:strand:- start:201 stop:452 length:252 start_codon:yes stop_codon:yes gene_type:complete